MDEDRSEKGGVEPTAEESRSLVDRVRATIGESSDADSPFSRETLSAWLDGDERPARPTQAPAPAPAVPATPLPIAAEDPIPRRRRRFDTRLLLVSALAFALAVAVVATTTLAVVNARRASDWEQRTQQIEVRTKIINDLLVERSHDVNARTRALNASAAQLRRTKQALARSEADVRALVRRQTELANEKAQAEDSR